MNIKQFIYFFTAVFFICFGFNAWAQVDQIVIEKSVRKMYLLDKNNVVKTYRVSLSYDAVGPKQKQGDGKTPEGQYIISGRNANSSYHKALVISYPNFEDRQNAQKKRGQSWWEYCDSRFSEFDA